MGLFDKFTGSRRPSADLTPRSADEVWDALMDLNDPEAPYLVRDGAEEGADLVAEWRIMEPAWHGFFATREVSRRVRVQLKLMPERHEVRALQEQWKIEWRDGVPVSKEYSRGPGGAKSRTWTIGGRPEGGLGVTEIHRFDSAELTDRLRDEVLTAGWSWRGMVFGLT